MIRWHIITAFSESKKNKLRFAMAIIVISLSIGLIVAVNGLVDNIAYNYSETAFSELSDSDVIVQREDGGIIRNISSLNNAFSNSRLQGISYRFYVDGNIIFTAANGKNASFPTKIVGINFTQENFIGLGEFNPKYEKLGLNQSLMFGNFGQQVTSNLGYNISTKLSFLDGKEVFIALEVVELVDQYKKFSTNSWNVIIVSLETLYQFTQNDSASTIVGVFEDHQNLYSINNIEDSLKKAKDRGSIIQKILGFIYTVSLPLAERFESAQNSLDSQRIILNFIGIVVLIVTGVLIFGLTNIAIEDKSYDFGIYRALGLKNSHILFQAFLQAFLKGFLGIIFGLLFGFFLVSFFISSDSLIIPISLETYFYATIMGILLILFSTLYPVLQSTKKEILLALDLSKVESSSFESRITTAREGWIVWRKILYGILFSSMAVLLFVIIPYLQFFHGQQMLNSFALLLLVFCLMGFILIILGFLGPLVTQSILFLFSKIFRKSSLGVKIFLRKNSRRNNITSIIFALSLAFVFFMSTLQSTQFQGSIYNLQSNLGSDLVVVPADPTNDNLSSEILTFMENRTNIKSSFVTTGNIFPIIGSIIEVGDNLFFNSFNPQVYATESDLLEVLFDETELVPNSKFSSIDNNGTVIISNSMAKALDLGIGDNLRLRVFSPIEENQLRYGKNLYLEIVGILNRLPGFPEVGSDVNNAERAPIFVGTNTWLSILSPVTNETSISNHEKYIQQIFVRGSITTINTVKLELFVEFGTSILILDYDDLLTQFNTALERSVNNLTIILSLSITIALFAVISGVSSSVTESKKDIGILKAVGLRDNMIAAIFMLESVVISITATILGGIAGYITAYLPNFNNSLNNNYPIILVSPPDAIIFTYFFAFLLAIIGAYIPSRRISKMQVMDIFRK